MATRQPSTATLLRDGPVGADNRRPLLSSTWAGVAARRPAAAQPGQGLGSAATGGTCAPSGGRGPIIDADGFQMVQRRNAVSRGGNGATAASTATEAAAPVADATPLATPRGDDDGDDVAMGDGGGTEPPPRREAAGEDDDGPEAAEEGPSEQELMDQMQLDQRLLAWVKAQGLEEGHPRRVQAEQQAAESRRAWQETRPRATPSSRMRWAEEALLKARKGAARMEQAIAELDDWYEEEREARQKSLQEWRAKVRMREEKLSDITREAAENYSPEAIADPCDPRTGLLQEAFHSLGQSIGPALEQLREAAPEGSEMQQHINTTLSAVFDLYGTIGSAVSAEYQQEYQDQPQQQQHGRDQGQAWNAECGATQYHIGDDWTYGGGGGWYGGYGGWGGSDHGGWDWHRHEGGYGDGGAWQGDARMDTTEAQVPKWMRRESAADGDHGERSWKKGRTNGDVDESMGTQGGAPSSGAQLAGGGSSDGQGRGGATSSGGPAGAANGGGTAADEEALTARREEVLKQATTDGVAVDPAAIASMPRAELEAWAKNNLL